MTIMDTAHMCKSYAESERKGWFDYEKKIAAGDQCNLHCFRGIAARAVSVCKGDNLYADGRCILY